MSLRKLIIEAHERGRALTCSGSYMLLLLVFLLLDATESALPVPPAFLCLLHQLSRFRIRQIPNIPNTKAELANIPLSWNFLQRPCRKDD